MLESTLAQSIEKIGLISPPVIQPLEDHYIIVSGFRRVAACRRLGLDTITAACLPASASRTRCAMVAIADNTANRSLNLVELSCAYNLLRDASKEADIDQIIESFSSVGISMNREMLSKLEIIGRIPHALQQGLIDETVALPSALRIYEISDLQLIEELAHLFGELNLSLNRQRELLDWLEAITIRESIPMMDILTEKELSLLRGDMSLDPGHKSNLIRKYLKHRRYPNITEFEQRYDQHKKALKLPKGVQLTPPPHFEGQHFDLKITFKDEKELVRLNQEVGQLAESKALSDLLKTAFV